ncbi:MAG: hypothetical protein ACRC2N_09415 [Aeromonas sp.]
MNTITETELMQMLERNRDQITKMVRMTQEPKRRGRPQIHTEETKQVARELAAVIGATSTAAILNIPLPTLFRITEGHRKATPSQIAEFMAFAFADKTDELRQLAKSFTA